MLGELNSKMLAFIVAMLTLIAIATRLPFFIVLDAIMAVLLVLMVKSERGGLNFSFGKGKKQVGHVIVKDGIYKIDKSIKGVLVVDDIPFDYRDLSDEKLRASIVSFHKVLDAMGEVQIVFVKKAIDTTEFLNKLFQRAQNLRVYLETDPSNERAKTELQMVEEMINKIKGGEAPFRYAVYFIVNAGTEKEALSSIKMLKKGLESVGIKARIATKNDIYDLLQDRIKFHKKVAFPTTVPYLTVFSLPKTPRFELLEDGVYIGREIGTNRVVFWNFKKMINQHVLLVGPTGAGKTETLISLAYKVNMFANIPVVFFDTKSDIRLRLKKYGIKIKVLNPLIYNLGLLDPGNQNLDSYITQLESIITNSYQLDKYTAAVLYKALKNAFISYEEYKKKNPIGEKYKDYLPTWDDVLRQIESLEDLQTQVRFYLNRIITQIKNYDRDTSNSIIDKINSPDIYVIDLSLLKSEEIKRLIMLTVLTKIYHKYHIADDKLKIALVVDEAWTILKDVDEYSIIVDIIKRGRGYGIMLLMATQNIEDLGQHSDIYLENIGLIAFMNNGDKKFWQEVLRFVNINDDEIKNQLMFLGRGEALMRFITDPRPVVVRLDTLANSSN